jgi:hypothetical protein
MQWWLEVLKRPFLGRPIPGPCELADICAYSDASSGVGIRIVIRERWRAWRLLPGWNWDSRDIGWAEAVGFELLIRSIFDTCTESSHFKVYGDNQGVVEGWWNGRSRNKPTNDVFRRIHQLTDRSGCTIHTRYVASALNPADDPSRGVYPPSHHLLPPVDIPAELQEFITDYDAPLTTSELRSRAAGHTPRPQKKSERAIPQAYFTLESQIEREGHELFADTESWRY